MTHVLLATGDLAMDRDDYDESFVATRDLLHSADVTFGQLETSFAESGVRAPQARHAVRARKEGAVALARAGRITSYNVCYTKLLREVYRRLGSRARRRGTQVGRQRARGGESARRRYPPGGSRRTGAVRSALPCRGRGKRPQPLEVRHRRHACVSHRAGERAGQEYRMQERIVIGTKRLFVLAWLLAAMPVITSYSIHYTKLYDPGSRSHRLLLDRADQVLYVS